jgi:hypothetical protein
MKSDEQRLMRSDVSFQNSVFLRPTFPLQMVSYKATEVGFYSRHTESLDTSCSLQITPELSLRLPDRQRAVLHNSQMRSPVHCGWGYPLSTSLQYSNIKMVSRSAKRRLPLQTNKQTPWRWVLLGKQPVAYLLKNFPRFHGNRRFITVFTRALRWSLSSVWRIESIPLHPISLRSILIGLPSGIFHSGFTIKILFIHRSEKWHLCSPSYC